MSSAKALRCSLRIVYYAAGQLHRAPLLRARLWGLGYGLDKDAAAGFYRYVQVMPNEH